MIDLKEIIDFTDRAHSELGRYMIEFTLPPDHIKKGGMALAALDWKSINYGDAELDQVPDNKRGIYAFAVHHPSALLPPHGYILYIGIAGRDSKRALRDRYRDYLNPKKVMKRAHIARMIGDWHPVLKFFFAPIGDNISTKTLQKLEEQLNTALLPPFSRGDLEASTKEMKRAFS